MAREFPTISIKKISCTKKKKKKYTTEFFIYSETALIYTTLTQL